MCVCWNETNESKVYAIFGDGRIKFMKLQSKRIADIDDGDDDAKPTQSLNSKTVRSFVCSKINAKPHAVRPSVKRFELFALRKLQYILACRLMIKCSEAQRIPAYFLLLLPPLCFPDTHFRIWSRFFFIPYQKSPIT